MTSYFDNKTLEVMEGVLSHIADVTLIECVRNIERDIIQDVSLVTGDREFPEDLREKIQTVIACKAIQPHKGGPENERAKEWLLAVRSSELLADLHSAFHVVGSRRIEVRFGVLSDNPQDFLTRRKDHDKEKYANL